MQGVLGNALLIFSQYIKCKELNKIHVIKSYFLNKKRKGFVKFSINKSKLRAISNSIKLDLPKIQRVVIKHWKS